MRMERVAVFFRNPRMNWLMGYGADKVRAFRYFETAKRKTWAGAKDAITHTIELVEQLKAANADGEVVRMQQ